MKSGKISAITLAAVMTVTLAGCGDDGQSEMSYSSPVDYNSLNPAAVGDFSAEEETDNPESLFDYNYESEYGGMSITGYNGTSESVEIPSSIDGVKVVMLGNEAFMNNTTVTSVTIPESVTVFAGFTFYGCESLTSVNIPKNTTFIGGFTFYNCPKISSVTIPDSVETIGMLAFSGCTSIKATYRGKTYNYSQIDDLYDAVNNGVGTQDAPVTEAISESDFEIGSSGNEYGINITGYHGSAANLIIPETINGSKIYAIDSEAFYGNKSLTSVTVPEGTLAIFDGAFANCSNLKSVTLPDNLWWVTKGAFDGCTSLTSLTYKGVTYDYAHLSDFYALPFRFYPM